MQEDYHVFQGLKRKGHEIRQEAEFLWDAYNIRLTNREGNSAFSITNERGPKDTQISYKGNYIGHCILNNYLVVFTYYEGESYIYRTEKKANSYQTIILYKGSNLNLNPKYPIETLADFETNLIQKVYWTDGFNSPRVINIATPELKDIKLEDGINVMEACGFNTIQFDFVQILKLQENITITKNYGSGNFSPGTIQYAFTYYNKYGSESSIFYTTPLQYISFINRGGREDESVANNFTININKVDTSFQYLRIYSIHRSAPDGMPNVLKVADLAINGQTNLTYIDTGQIGEVVDQKQLLFIGGEELIAGTMCSKDGTLFLGNIQIKRPATIKWDKNIDGDINISADYRYISNHTTSINTPYYKHMDNLNNCPGFKSGEIYRLGIQFQYKTGKWSDPIYIADKLMPIENRPTQYKSPQFVVTIPKNLIVKAKNKGFLKVRGLIVKPDIKDRTILAQGMICPTVFNVGARKNGAPFAQSSWFLRPTIPAKHNTDGTTSYFNPNINYDPGSILTGSAVEFRHMYSLLSFDHSYDYNGTTYQCANRGAEIQCNQWSPSIDTINHRFKDPVDTKDESDYKDVFVVDQSIVTFHSPDIEFDDTTQYAISQEGVDLRIVGLIGFSHNAGDIQIQTATPTAGINAKGVTCQSICNKDSGKTSQCAGLYYQDNIIDDNSETEITVLNTEVPYLVYPWHRKGSLNNDINRPQGQGTRTAELKTKVTANLKFSDSNTWLPTTWEAAIKANGITIPQIFNSNEMSLIKIPSPKNSYLEDLTYYGNVDTLISADKKYPAACTTKNKSIAINEPLVVPINKVATNVGDYQIGLKQTNDPIRIKYKSTPHAVFTFNYNDQHFPHKLPHTIYEGTKKSWTIPYWEDQNKYNKESRSINNVCNYIEQLPSEPFRDQIAYVKNLEISQYDPCRLFQFRLDKASNSYMWKQGVVTKNSEDIDTTSIFILSQLSQQVLFYKQRKEISSDNLSYTLYSDLISQDQTDIYRYPLQYVEMNNEDVQIYPYLYLAELYRKDLNKDTIYGGNTPEAIQNNMWIPASEPIIINQSEVTIPFIYGDTWYSRYDCLKTYSFSKEDENQIIEIGSFLCETRVNIDGRYDKNRGQTSNLHVSPQNFNLINKAYTQLDTFFNYRILDDLLQKDLKKEQQVTWTLQKFPAMDVDPWTNITDISVQNMLGNAGPITKIVDYIDRLLCFQYKGISQILFNSRVQVPTSDGVSIEITNSNKVEGIRAISNNIGCQNKNSICVAPTGVYFVDNFSNQIYNIGEGITSISSAAGLSQYVNTEFKCVYDDKYNDIYFIPFNDDKALCYSTTLQQFTSFMSYGRNESMFNIEDKFYSLRTQDGVLKLYENNEGEYNVFYGSHKPWNFTFISNNNPKLTKVFDTFEFIDSEEKDSIICPINYVNVQNEYQEGTAEGDKINIKKKFRVWRGIIPRNTKRESRHKDRIRNTWTRITLGYNPDTSNNKSKVTIHSVSVKYTG